MAACKIAHEENTGVVNLFHVAYFVMGDHARRHVEGAMKDLGMPHREEQRVSGRGPKVIVGTHDDALAIARHLKASDEELTAIAASLATSTNSSKDGAPVAAERNQKMDLGNENVNFDEKEDQRISVQTEIQPSTFDEARDKDIIKSFLMSWAPYPVEFNEKIAGWLGYARVDNAIRALKKAIKTPEFAEHIEVRIGTDSLGRKKKCYFLTVEGFKIFCLVSHTTKAMQICKVFVDLDSRVGDTAKGKGVLLDGLEGADKERVQTAFTKLEDAHVNNLTDALIAPGDTSESKEFDVRDRLAFELSGKVEVPCRGGRVDVVTDSEIIEVKQGRNWSHALGQVLKYSFSYPQKRMRVHLFDVEGTDLDLAKNVCDLTFVRLTYE